MMHYVSTRGVTEPVTSAGAIRLGIAPDGGLFIPEVFTRIDPEIIRKMLSFSYQELATAILGLYLTDYREEDLRKMTASAYEVPGKFANPAVTPVVGYGDGQYLLELWHGPTCAFKDIALQILPYLMTRANTLSGSNAETVILVATSGDTGKAALEGFRDVPGTKIIVFFPEEGVSVIQRSQMVTQIGANTFVAAVYGNFDDAQNGVKQIFTDPVLKENLATRGMVFSSANSINWGRLAPQIVYYFFGYLELCRQGNLEFGATLNIAVPTGNFGNILAAYIAKQMGLPLGKLICASNSNNVLTDFIQTGEYDRNRQFYTTISPSMDILISSNLERLLFDLADRNPELVRNWMSELKTTGRYRVTGGVAERVREEFYSGFADERETMAEIKRLFGATGIVLDPHTAVGTVVTRRYREESGDNTPVLVAATASPFKFNASVLEAIQGPAAVVGKTEFELLVELEALTGQKIPKGLQGLDQMEVRHKTVCRKEEMAETTQGFLKIK